MFSKLSALFGVVIVAQAALVAAADALSLDKPNLTACQPVTFNVKGGVGPYQASIVPSSDQCVEPLFELPESSGASINWTVKLTPGTKVAVVIEDSTGAEFWTDDVTVGGDNVACLAVPSSSAPASSAPASSTRTPLSVSGTSRPTTSPKPSSSAGADGVGNVGDNVPQGAASTTVASTGLIALFSALSALYILA